MELGFTGGRLSRMIFADSLEQTTLVAMFDVQQELVSNDPLGALCAVLTYEVLHRTGQGDSVVGVVVSLLLEPPRQG